MAYFLAKRTTIFIDIDETLIRNIGVKQIPIPAMVKHVEMLYEQGAQMYCWSSGGADYAREVVTQLRIDHCFKAFLPKPDVLIDDMAIDRWNILQVHPNQAIGLSLEDYRNKQQTKTQ